jgi:hypothetical protein
MAHGIQAASYCVLCLMSSLRLVHTLPEAVSHLEKRFLISVWDGCVVDLSDFHA